MEISKKQLEPTREDWVKVIEHTKEQTRQTFITQQVNEAIMKMAVKMLKYYPEPDEKKKANSPIR